MIGVAYNRRSTLPNGEQISTLVALAGAKRCVAAQAPNNTEYFMEFSGASTHTPPGQLRGTKTARMTVRITISNQGGPPAGLADVRFELRDRTGKITPARVAAGPVKMLPELAAPGRLVGEFEAAVYDYAIEPGERYVLRGVFRSVRAFGKPIRFEKSADPLPEETWEKRPAARPGRRKTGTPIGGRRPVTP